jgi:hypothetical protein
VTEGCPFGIDYDESARQIEQFDIVEPTHFNRGQAELASAARNLLARCRFLEAVIAELQQKRRDEVAP